MKETILFAAGLAAMASGCAGQSADPNAEENSPIEIGQPLEEGTYRYIASHFRNISQTQPNTEGIAAYPSVYVPEIASQLVFRTWGGTGDLDLQVTLSGGAGVECLSANPTTEERCQYADPLAGWWSVRTIHELDVLCEGVHYNASYTLPVQYDVDLARGATPSDSWATFGPYPVAPGSRFSAAMNLQSGQPDVYVRWDADPDLDNWDCRSSIEQYPANGAACDLTVPDGATVAHVGVHANPDPFPTKARYLLRVIWAEAL